MVDQSSERVCNRADEFFVMGHDHLIGPEEFVGKGQGQGAIGGDDRSSVDQNAVGRVAGGIGRAFAFAVFVAVKVKVVVAIPRVRVCPQRNFQIVAQAIRIGVAGVVQRIRAKPYFRAIRSPVAVGVGEGRIGFMNE